MNFVKIGNYRINVDRITHVEETPSGDVYIYFGEHSDRGEATQAITLQGSEADDFLEWLDIRAADVTERQ